jgi:hypothetical protein
MSLDGTRCATVDELKQVILRLPAGSRVTWEIGCLGYPVIPVGTAPYIKKADFESFCLQHNVTFVMTRFEAY